MTRDEIQRRVDAGLLEIQREAERWRGATRARLERAVLHLAIVSAAIPQATARELRAAEALLDAALDTLVRHAVARLELELENNR